jgi:single-strand DNA-binding protein
MAESHDFNIAKDGSVVSLQRDNQIFIHHFNLCLMSKLIGNLGQDPEIRILNSGKKVGQVSIATSDSFKDGNGEYQQRTQWHNLVAWGPQAEYLEKYLHKGSFIGVRGKLTHRSFDGKDGKKMYRTEIIVKEFVSFGKREKELSF